MLGGIGARLVGKGLVGKGWVGLRAMGGTPRAMSSSVFDNRVNDHIWLRAECLPGEKRTPLTAADASDLIAEGYRVTVEKSSQRIIPTEAYEAIGCDIVEEHAWKNQDHVPEDAFILGLKHLGELPDQVAHRHIYFAHCFKEQSGWQKEMTRFESGNGAILDLEFLTDEDGRRVAAFGYYAGYAGMAIGMRHAFSNDHSKLVPWSSFATKEKLLDNIASGVQTVPRRVVVIGALGAAGRGAVQAFKDVVARTETDVALSAWDIDEMALPSTRPDILQHDLFVNCVYVRGPTEPFVTTDGLALGGPDRPLRHLVDVSCDPNSPYNPIPVYNTETSFSDPVHTVSLDAPGVPPLQVVGISNLPSLLPLEASEFFSSALLPSLLELRHGGAVWKRAEQVYEKVRGDLRQ
mmetsp:Transcript_6319/g.17894  ORF Transcript_6319/g.17894 Transcript_6319/m.17894 type:complete len:406 (-) Transcript_6319:1111-2328(-)